MEKEFEAAVFNARADAKLASDAGFPQRACDQVAAALADLWEAGKDAGLSDKAIGAIARRYVEFDDAGEAWPRDMPPSLH